MRKLIVVLGILAIVVVAGCGGGSSSPDPVPDPPATTFSKSTADNSVTVTGATAALPAGVSETAITLTSKAADSYSPALTGPAFVAAIATTPVATFSSAVTLTFHLSVAIPAGEEVRLYELSGVNWIDTGIKATLSADRLTATVDVTSFPAGLNYLLLKATP